MPGRNEDNIFYRIYGLLGGAADAPASASADEDTTTRSHTSLLKGIKNLAIDAVGHLATLAGVDFATSGKQDAGNASLAALEVTIATPGGATLTSDYKAVTSAGAAEALGGDVDCLEVVVVADPDNSGNIYLGDSSIDNTQGKLPPGAVMPCGPCNLSEVFIDADNSGEGVSIFYR